MQLKTVSCWQGELHASQKHLWGIRKENRVLPSSNNLLATGESAELLILKGFRCYNSANNAAFYRDACVQSPEAYHQANWHVVWPALRMKMSGVV
eukprot:1160306-Pelagomonas_calceolata.AAC.3